MRLGTLLILGSLVATTSAHAADAPASPPAANTLSPEDVREGFVSLFDGKTLAGWAGAVKGYVVEDGAIVCMPKGGGKLYTEKQYSDFILRFEFKLTPGANNGVGLRMPPEGDAAYNAMEIQVLDDTAEKYAKLQPYQYHGSIYGVVPAQKGHQKPVGQWNSEEILAQGPHIKVVLNGAVIVDAMIDKFAEGTLDHRPHPGLLRPTGHIGWLGHGARVEFRNIRIRELK